MDGSESCKRFETRLWNSDEIFPLRIVMVLKKWYRLTVQKPLREQSLSVVCGHGVMSTSSVSSNPSSNTRDGASEERCERALKTTLSRDVYFG